MMAAMAVDLTTGIGENIIKNNNMNNIINNCLNNQHTAVDLSLPKECVNESRNLDITTSITNSDDTMDIIKRLMKVTGSDITKDKSQIELTALNLLCLARLQEMLTKGPEGRHPLPAHLHPSQLGSSPSPWNRKMYSCDYGSCGKVRNMILLNHLKTLNI